MLEKIKPVAQNSFIHQKIGFKNFFKKSKNEHFGSKFLVSEKVAQLVKQDDSVGLVGKVTKFPYF